MLIYTGNQKRSTLMKGKIMKTGFFLLLSASIYVSCAAQDKRMQYPHFLLNKYFGVSEGHITYLPPIQKLEAGYNAQEIRLPHPGVRIIFGHDFNKFLSAELSYMRPVDWILYRNINGDQQQHSVWTNVVGLTLITHTEILKNLTVFGEGGLGYITQTGFKINNQFAVKDENYIDFLFGGGIQYHLNEKWALNISGLFPTSTKTIKGPYKTFYSAGFTYSIHKLPETILQNTSQKNSPVFPKNVVQVGYATNTFGYGVNAFAEKTYIFWGGDVEIKNGFTVQYQHNVFHTRKIFSLSWGSSVGYWKTKQHNDDFVTISIFPVLRFTVIHSKPADLYFNYSVAGPTFISRVDMDGHDTGSHFTFQDYLGIGTFAGKNRKFNAEIRIAHYSNGDLVPQNGGIKIPLTFNLGYTF